MRIFEKINYIQPKFILIHRFSKKKHHNDVSQDDKFHTKIHNKDVKFKENFSNSVIL